MVSREKHIGEYVSRRPMIDAWRCSCGWQSPDYYDDAHYAEEDFREHVRIPGNFNKKIQIGKPL